MSRPGLRQREERVHYDGLCEPKRGRKLTLDAERKNWRKRKCDSFNISDVLTPNGWLQDADGNKIRVIHKVGKKEGAYYWNNERFCEQMKSAMVAFNSYYELRNERDFYYVRPVLLIDHAPLHKSRPENALNPNNLNVKPGGEQPWTADGYFFDEHGNKVTQRTWFMDHGVVKQKGMKLILEERGIDTRGMVQKDMIQRLQQEQDFMEDAERINVRIAIKEIHPYAECKLFPKFHCELNSIENAWCDGKNRFRSEQDFRSLTDEELMNRVDRCLDAIPVERMRKFIWNSILWCYAYETNGEGSVGNIDFVKKLKEIKKEKKRHRSVMNIDLD